MAASPIVPYFTSHPKEVDETIDRYVERISSIGNFSVGSVKKIYYRDKKRTNGTPTSTVTESTTIAGDKCLYEGTFDFPIKTEEEAIKYSKVDLDKWEVDKIIIKHWSTTTKDKNGKANITQNSGVTLHLKKRAHLTADNTKAEMMEWLKSIAPTYPPLYHKSIHGEHLLEINIFDLHLGKLAWRGETGEDYDLEIAEKRFYDGLESLISKSSPYRIGKILFPFGNDFFNADNMFNTTTAGTPQDQDGRWMKIYTKGRKMLHTAATMLAQIAPVEMVLVQGNHDHQTSFYVGDALECAFANNPDVTIDNKPVLRKYKTFGNCLIGYTHGDGAKDVKLPLLMAQEAKEQWAASDYREWHLGHFHTQQTKQTASGLTVNTEEYNGVIVRKLPSLSGTDAWHHKMGYKSLQAAHAMIWDKEQGVVAILHHNL